MGKRGRAGIFWLFLCLTASNGWGASLPFRSGWVFVPGAEDMIAAGLWNCTAGVTVVSDTLSISAPGSGYSTPVNTTGPALQVPGDFSVLATLSDPSGAGAFLTLVGT